MSGDTTDGPGSSVNRRTFGHHPLYGFVDHGTGGCGEPVAELLRPGRAGSNTAADHVAVFDAALAQLPAPLRRRDEHGRRAVLVRTDAAGATREFAHHLAAAGVEFSLGAKPGPLRHPHRARRPARRGVDPGLPSAQAPRRRNRRADRTTRRAWVAEVTGLVDLSSWPPGTRLILRKERPHPGAQLRITDHDGMRITGFLTTTPDGPSRQLPDLELRHRRHARVEDRIRNSKDTGLRNLPYHDMAQNRIWTAVAALASDLLAWTARLALPASAATYEPKRLRLRILAVAGRIVRTARRGLLKIDPAWPWADVITTAHTRLTALPTP